MKSAHRHQLETNALAQRLDVIIERMRPYAATAAGIVVAVVVLMFVWSYVSGSSAARQGAAWDAYHRGVAAMPPNLEQLRRSAEEYPGTKMQQLANITWADGQVYNAARDYFYNRDGALEALRRATSTYQGILQTSDDERLVNRAHLGLARVYEMQNELEKAREEYLKVRGGYETLAKQQAERLAKPETQEAYAWLSTARAPRPKAPSGPGTPGQRPEFTTGDIALPAETPDGDATEAPGAASVEEMLKGFDLGFPKSDEADRYKEGDDEPTDEALRTNGGLPNLEHKEVDPVAPPQSDVETTESAEGPPPSDEKTAE
jgi:hypothetical protein